MTARAGTSLYSSPYAGGFGLSAASYMSGYGLGGGGFAVNGRSDLQLGSIVGGGSGVQESRNFCNNVAMIAGGTIPRIMPGANNGGPPPSGLPGGAGIGAPMNVPPPWMGGGMILFGGVVPGGTGSAGGGTNVHAGSARNAAAKPNAAQPAKPDEAKKAAEAMETTRKDWGDTKRLQLGYSPQEWTQIQKDAEAAAGNDAEKYKTIMRALPDKNFKTPATGTDNKSSDPSVPQQQQEWVRKFGEWHTRYIGNVSDAGARKDIVEDVAGGGSVTYSLQQELEPGSKAQRYKVTAADGAAEVQQGDHVYYNAGDKKWYKEYKDKQYSRPLNVPTEARAPAKDHQISVTGGSDYLEVRPNGVRQLKDGLIVERYVIGAPHGSNATRTSEDIGPNAKDDGGYNLYYDRKANTWFYIKKDGTDGTLPANTELRNGRLYFSRGNGLMDTTLANGETKYIDDLRAREATYKADHPERPKDASATTAVPKTPAEEQKGARVDTVMGQVKEKAGAAGNDLTYTYDPATGTLALKADTTKCDGIAKGLEDDPAQKDKKAETKSQQVDKALAQLPAGTKVTVNGHAVAGTLTAASLRDALKREVSGEIKINEPRDLRSLAGSKDPVEAVYQDLSSLVRAQRNQNHNPTAIVFAGEIKLPKGMTQKQFQEGVATKIAKENPTVPVTFKQITQDNMEPYQLDVLVPESGTPYAHWTYGPQVSATPVPMANDDSREAGKRYADGRKALEDANKAAQAARGEVIEARHAGTADLPAREDVLRGRTKMLRDEIARQKAVLAQNPDGRLQTMIGQYETKAAELETGLTDPSAKTVIATAPGGPAPTYGQGNVAPAAAPAAGTTTAGNSTIVADLEKARADVEAAKKNVDALKATGSETAGARALLAQRQLTLQGLMHKAKEQGADQPNVKETLAACNATLKSTGAAEVA